MRKFIIDKLVYKLKIKKSGVIKKQKIHFITSKLNRILNYLYKEKIQIGLLHLNFRTKFTKIKKHDNSANFSISKT